MAGKIKIKLVRSGIGRPRDHRETLKGLGLTRMHKEVTLNDTPAIRGMINKVQHLIAVLPE